MKRYVPEMGLAEHALTLTVERSFVRLQLRVISLLRFVQQTARATEKYDTSIFGSLQTLP